MTLRSCAGINKRDGMVGVGNLLGIIDSRSRIVISIRARCNHTIDTNIRHRVALRWRIRVRGHRG